MQVGKHPDSPPWGLLAGRGAGPRALCLSPPLSLCFLGPPPPSNGPGSGQTQPPRPSSYGHPFPTLRRASVSCGRTAAPWAPVHGQAALRRAAQPRPQAPGCRGHFPTKARREGCTHPSRMPRGLAGRVGRGGGGIPVAARGPLPRTPGGPRWAPEHPTRGGI